MLYRPSIFVSPEKVKLVSTFVASTFTPAITPPLGSVTRPVRVAVGPARREPATRQVTNIIRISHAARLRIISSTPEFLYRLRQSIPPELSFCTNTHSGGGSRRIRFV